MTASGDKRKISEGRPRQRLFPEHEPPPKLEAPFTLDYLERAVPCEFRRGANRRIATTILSLERDEGVDELSGALAKRFLAPLTEARAELKKNQAKGSPSAALKRTTDSAKKWIPILRAAACKGIDLDHGTTATRKIRKLWPEIGDGSTAPTERTIKNNIDKYKLSIDHR